MEKYFKQKCIFLTNWALFNGQNIKLYGENIVIWLILFEHQHYVYPWCSHYAGSVMQIGYNTRPGSGIQDESQLLSHGALLTDNEILSLL